MSKFFKVLFCMLVVMLVSVSTSEKTAYAEEESNQIIKEIELTEEQKQQVMKRMQEGNELASQTLVKEFLYVTEDAPDDVMTVLNQRSTTNEYRIENYASTCVFQTEIFGRKINVITIGVIGEVYVYEDGKIHLYSMRVVADVHVIGSAEIDEIEILNTDGSTSMGKAYVYLDTWLYGDHGFACWVYVLSGNISSTEEAVIDVSIEQAY